ncbi:hypothetical protein [Bacillus thuringiensis]|uniref:hypothetical protein n=1 Tax=Bacillus thuringiensis TaxID=1428 RepID=UPI002AB5C6CD|nr:hypothetical protein [Bacillus thuringiensis]MDY7964970.1 hypothetical protein [Bacillus thuringiensis]
MDLDKIVILQERGEGNGIGFMDSYLHFTGTHCLYEDRFKTFRKTFRYLQGNAGYTKRKD